MTVGEVRRASGVRRGEDGQSGVTAIAATRPRAVAAVHELPRAVLTDLLASRSPAGGPDAVERALTAADWPALVADANRHTVGVLLLQRLRELGAERALPDGVAAAWEADRRHARLQHILQLRDAHALSAGLTDAGIAHAFMKGFAYRLELYRPSWVRIGGDVDVLIDRRHVARARGIAQDLGFSQARFSDDHQRMWRASQTEIREAEAAHHELAEFNKDHYLDNAPEWLLEPPFVLRSPFAYAYRGRDPVMRSSIDMHWALHFLFEHFDVLEEVHGADAGSGPLPVVSREWSIIFSAFKLYYESFDRPRFGFTHVADLIALSGAPGLRWSLVDDVARGAGIGAALFYTLGACEGLTARRLVPAELMQAWSTVDEPASSRPGSPNLDFGDFVPYLVGRRSAGGIGAPADPAGGAHDVHV